MICKINWFFAFFLAFIVLIYSCKETKPSENQNRNDPNCFVTVLGTLQDGGSPQAGCSKNCCNKYYDKPDRTRNVVSLALVDETNKKRYLFEAGPDFTKQLYTLNSLCRFSLQNPWPDAIFITHAHVGHYSGLINLGRECLNSKYAKVYAMPRMNYFLEHHGPWDQLCSNRNIQLVSLKSDSLISFSDQLSVQAILVPHRDEYSETVGFIIHGPEKRLLFIPDIDKWEKWARSLIDVLKQVDYALLDGTFYGADEVPGRDLSEIPHPFVSETMDLLKYMTTAEKQKVHFIHLNHSNPLLDTTSEAYKNVINAGFCVARYGQQFNL